MDQQASTAGPSKTDKFFTKKTEVSKVKHGVLKRYLGAWFAIMSLNKSRKYTHLVYVDGFSGKGDYSDGEGGSPVIVYELALTHKVLRSGGPHIYLIFIEKDSKTCETLMNNMRELEEKHRSSKNASLVSFMVINGGFDQAITWVLQSDFVFPVNSSERIFNANESSQHWTSQFITSDTPLMVFVDPFGYTGFPMTLMRQILETSSRSEIFLNLMTGSIRRFFGIENRTRPINKLLGDNEWDATWKDILNGIRPSEDKLKAFTNFYIMSLSRECSSELFTSLFEIKDERNILKYHLLYATKHVKGHIEIKNAMRKESHSELNFKFSVFSAAKPGFSKELADVTQLVKKEFNGRKVTGAEITGWFDTHPTLNQHHKNELKKSLEEFRCTDKESPRKRKFDEMMFDFTGVGEELE